MTILLCGYLIIGLLVAVFTAGMLWRRTALSNSRSRLLLICAVIVLAWPGIGILALADKELTARDYVDSWLFPSPSEE